MTTPGVHPGPPAPVRTCMVHCPDWPVVAAVRRDPSLAGQPVVVHARSGARDLVVAASAAARAEGVRIGMRRREAEAAAAGAVVLSTDPAHEARVFEAVVRAVEAISPRLEVLEPGRLAFATRGPSRYFGGDAALAAAVRTAVLVALDTPDPAPDPAGASVAGAAAGSVAGSVAGPDVRVGIADGRFTARLATRRSSVVPPGGSAAFCAPFPVSALGDPELAVLLERLGLVTLGQFAGLDPVAVLERFGTDGLRQHTRASGADPEPIAADAVPPQWCETIEFDPPVQHVDAVAFSAKAAAERLTSRLADLGLACTCVLVEAETEHGERFARRWRHDDGFRPGVLAERVRWQFDRTTGALTAVWLRPEEIVPVPTRQLGFFGGDPVAAQRADRALTRVQGMLGHEAVTTMVVQGGRTPAERVEHVAWGEPRHERRPLHEGRLRVAWPGAVPGPAPSRVFVPGLAARLLDAQGAAVQVDSRGTSGSVPAWLDCPDLPGGGGEVTAWAGPWASDVRWWDPRTRSRAVRWHVVVRPDDSAAVVECAVLVTVAGGVATVDALHD